MGVLVFSIITTPFDYEGSVRARVAKEAVLEVKKYSDITVVISNQLLFKVTNQFTTFQDSFFIVDKMCASFVAGIIHIISENGLINLDFADLKSVMANKGDGIIGVGYGEGEKAAQEAIESALSNSLLEENADTVSDKKTASDALVHISGNRISLLEVEEIMKRIQSELGSDVNIIYGVSISEQPNAMLKKNDNKVSTDNVMNNNIFENSVFNLSSGYNLSSDFNSAQQQVQSIAQWVQVMVIITGVNKKIVQEESIKYNNLQINPIQSYTEDKLDFTNNKFEEPQNNIFAFLNKIGKQKI